MPWVGDPLLGLLGEEVDSWAQRARGELVQVGALGALPTCGLWMPLAWVLVATQGMVPRLEGSS